uniref:Prostate and testis expressed 1 n=1 Tax=Sciurus vulgaris TaxID=55149 RepID=A0A8D2DG99_SCIVU
MDTRPLLGFLILLCCLRVLSGSFSFVKNQVMEIIQCRMCHLQFPGENCSRGRGICMATTDEACTVGRMFKKDGTPWLTFMGCLKNCANVENIKWSIYLVSFRCCRSYDMCNENL